MAKGNAGTGQIIRGHFHGHAITQQNANIVLTHFTGKVSQHHMTVIQLYSKLSAGQSFNNKPSARILSSSFAIIPLYSPSLVNVLRLPRRIAFFFSMRRCSLLETNQRLRRTVLNTWLLTTFLRKRLRSESWDSPLRKFTDAKRSHLLSA